MKLVPLGDRVVLKQLVAEETTKSGIVLPGQNKEKPQQAEVVAVGPGGMVDGKEVTMSVKVGDRVMQLRNDYKKGVFNGDLGYIENIDTEDRILKVSFDGYPVEYESSDLDEITLAYAPTIHKSHDSEYPVVVMPVMMSHYIMLQRNLIYTGLTRAKKLCIMIGTRQALGCAIRNMAVLKRNTMLKDRLKG